MRSRLATSIALVVALGGAISLAVHLVRAGRSVADVRAPRVTPGAIARDAGPETAPSPSGGDVSRAETAPGSSGRLGPSPESRRVLAALRLRADAANRLAFELTRPVERCIGGAPQRVEFVPVAVHFERAGSTADGLERFVARRASPVVPRGHSLDVARLSSCVGLLVGREISLAPGAVDQGTAGFQETVHFPLSVLTAASR